MNRNPFLVGCVLMLAMLVPALVSAGLDLRVICLPCGDAPDCGDSTDLCLEYPGSGNFCGMHCLDDRDCAGLSCQPTEIDMLNQCVDVEGYCHGGPPFVCSLDEHCPAEHGCVNGHCEELQGELGEPCEEDSDCESDLCREISGLRICTLSCEGRLPVGGDCPDGFFCRTTDDSCGDGLCAAGGPGEKVLGDPCELPEDCEDLYCMTPSLATQSLCGIPCEPDEEACPEGMHCDSLGNCGICVDDQQLQPDGASCLSPEECVSGRCEDNLCGGAGDDAGLGPDRGTDSDPSLVSGCSCDLARPRAEAPLHLIHLILP